MITIGAIKKAAGTYDVEVVQRLSLPRMGLNKICNLENCALLVELSLPHNEIRKMEGLDALVKLEVLDLSCNQITKVNNLGSLESLERLDLRGNQISDCDALQGLAMAPKLTRLYLQLSSGKTREERLPNPVCTQAPYLGAVKRCAPALHFLDGESIALKAVVAGPDGGAEGGGAEGLLQPSKEFTVALPTESWYTAEDLVVPEASLADPTGADAAVAKQAVADLQGTVRECIGLHKESGKMIAAAEEEFAQQQQQQQQQQLSS